MALSPNRLAGVASLSIAGQTYLVVGELAWRVSGFTTETLKGQDGIHGQKAMPQAGLIKAKLRDTAGVSVASLAAQTNASVVAQTANGKVIVGNGMWFTGEPPEVNTEDGTFEVAFEGADVSET